MSTDLQTGRGPPATESLLERDAQLAVLHELLEDAASGHGALALVEGPPGVGKSALLERAAGMAREQGVAVLHARGHELERAFGWGVARSLLEASLGTDRDELLAGPAAPARVLFDEGEDGAGDGDSEPGFSILHALYWLVLRLAEREPLLLVVDDAHWADEPSLRFLVYLAGRLSDQPIGVVVGTRAGELGEGGLLRQLAGEPSAQGPDAAVARPGGGRRARATTPSGRRRRALRALLRADRGQSAAAARAARRDRAARPTPRRSPRRPRWRPVRSRARCCGGSPRCRPTRRRWHAVWPCSRTTLRCTSRRS